MSKLFRYFLLVLFGAISPIAYAQPALIPIPRQVKWEAGGFALKNCHYILVKDLSLQSLALTLGNYIAGKTGKKPGIINQPIPGATIVLSLGAVTAAVNNQEAYQLNVTTRAIRLKANTPEGVFRGLQTLIQLTDPSNRVKNCRIVDYPAYSWRGYMVDVARNFQSLAQLEQQVDVMGKYKLNIFHIHLTEDIAWRLEIRKFPQLTSNVNQLREAGKYYTVNDIKELIDYCRKRYITLVPEIDIPGHSGAFTRAMGYNMQTDTGMTVVKEIMKEICTTYDVPYIHIGADEVVIKNKQLLPGISALLQQSGKQVIGWAPGSNYMDGTIRQLWKGGKDSTNRSVKYIDSRSLYISDMDPLNTVVTIFNRRLGNQASGDSTMLGAEFCVWNDRRVNKEYELVSRNAVYPAMLAFAERSWLGGGYELAFNIGDDTSTRARAFREFENRLLTRQQTYFRGLPFAYVKQTSIKWNILGPFKNGGNLSSGFWPELTGTIRANTGGQPATGGTIWLWHTNSPAVKAWLPQFNANTTYYAYTNFYSDCNASVQFWIDFKDQSRSGADATPPAGQWDYKQSKVWVNNQLVDPPVWQFAGRPKGLLEQPLVDESFYYRKPVVIRVNRGWNQVLIKLPMDEFSLKDWQVPPKWMFTFIPVKKAGANWQLYPTIFSPSREKRPMILPLQIDKPINKK